MAVEGSHENEKLSDDFELLAKILDNSEIKVYLDHVDEKVKIFLKISFVKC